MKTQQFQSTILRGLLIAFLQVATFDITAQVIRQESTNQLKKVVYTVDPSTCPQFMMQKTNLYQTCLSLYPYCSYRYYALVSIPEITDVNMPAIELWWNNIGAGALPSMWSPVPTVSVAYNFDYGPLLSFVTNGLCAVLWKVEFQPPGFPNSGWSTNNHCPDLQITNILSRSNRIVVIYETPSNSNLFKLGASVSPSAVSLTVPTAAGRTYTVEHTPVLPPTSSWNILVSNIVGTGGPVSITDSNGAKQRFYRALEQ